MKTIICIVGGSGSGKTTLSIKLKDVLNIPYICSYTTRPMRAGETNGVEHIFVRKEDMPDKEDMLAYTEFGGHHYWTTFSQLDISDVWTYVIDEKGLIEMRERVKDNQFKIVTVKVNRSDLSGIDQSRKDRDNDRVVIPDEEYDLVINNNRKPMDMVNTFIDKFYPECSINYKHV